SRDWSSASDLGRTGTYVQIFEAFWYETSTNTHIFESESEPCFPQLLLSDIPQMIRRPERMIMVGIFFDERIHATDAQLLQRIRYIKFLKRLFCILVKVPDRMIQVEKYVIVFHEAN